MKQYTEIIAAKKLEILQKHSLGKAWASLDQKKWCLHCGKQFHGKSVRAYTSGDSRLWLECGTEGCDGSPIDWADHPWWDENHPLTQAADKAMDEALATKKEEKM